MYIDDRFDLLRYFERFCDLTQRNFTPRYSKYGGVSQRGHAFMDVPCGGSQSHRSAFDDFALRLRGDHRGQRAAAASGRRLLADSRRARDAGRHERRSRRRHDTDEECAREDYPRDSAEQRF